jgi:hypothetical protein
LYQRWLGAEDMGWVVVGSLGSKGRRVVLQSGEDFRRLNLWVHVAMKGGAAVGETVGFSDTVKHW